MAADYLDTGGNPTGIGFELFEVGEGFGSLLGGDGREVGGSGGDGYGGEKGIALSFVHGWLL